MTLEFKDPEDEGKNCWECGSDVNVVGRGRFARCGGCRTSERQQAREEAYRERFPEPEDGDGE